MLDQLHEVFELPQCIECRHISYLVLPYHKPLAIDKNISNMVHRIKRTYHKKYALLTFPPLRSAAKGFATVQSSSIAGTTS